MKPIPRKLLCHSVTMKVCSGTDAWQNPTYTTYALSKVRMELALVTKKTADNTLLTFSGTLFHDQTRSTAFDFVAQKAVADGNKGDMKVVFGTRTYTVYEVSPQYDETGSIHHTEVLLQ